MNAGAGCVLRHAGACILHSICYTCNCPQGIQQKGQVIIMANFVIDSNVVEETHPIFGDSYTYANGEGHTDNARVLWMDVCIEGHKMFVCTVAHNSVNLVNYDGDIITDVWDLVRA